MIQNECLTLELAQNSLEYVFCPICSSADALFIHKPKIDLPFCVYRCKGCEVDYLSPRFRETAMRKYYQADSYFDETAYEDYAEQELTLRATFRRLLERLHRLGHTGGRLLEIGCGYGFLLAEAAPYFSFRCGTDYSHKAVKHARKHADEVLLGGQDAVRDSKPLFDCIIANHVIEHVYDPLGFVRDLLALLRPGGCLLLSTPDAGSWWRRVMGPRWPSYKIPEHILYFTSTNLAALVREAGGQEPLAFPYPHAFPLTVIAAKVGWRFGFRWSRLVVWLPGTTTAVLSKRRLG
jgi:2-polyprenyl-3-methyl-5-hydroxy-6-metoxy-1,4-benzoquinol methylase